MLRIVATLAVIAALAGCGTPTGTTKPYQPQEHALRDGLIPKLAVNGNVQVSNNQPSSAEAIVYSYGATQFASNYKDITQLMVEQTKKEIAKNGKLSLPGKSKPIDLKVTYLQSKNVGFSWKSEIRYTATLGSVGVIEKTVTHASANLFQDLNGCIAEAVMNLLNDPRVIAYLAG